MELSYPPFEMTNTAGQPDGISVELAHSLGKHLGRKILIENIAFDGLIPALRTGTIDCIISSMTSTPERAKAIAFKPISENWANSPCRKNSPILSADDIKTVFVCCQTRTSAHKYAIKN